MKIEKLIRDICHEEGIHVDTFCDAYCLKLSKNNKTTFIYDSIFENNSSSVYKLLRDKSAVSEILSQQSVPTVEHYYFYSNTANYNDIWLKLEQLFEQHKKIVIKHNEGMSGKDVYLIETKSDLERLSSLIFQKYNSLSVCPYYKILHEYRIIFLNGEVKLIFDKIRPNVIGDGMHNIEELAEQKKYNYIDKNINPKLIPPKNQNVTLSWRHNLNYGAIPEIIKDKGLISKLSLLAQKAAKELNVNFASIDIIQTDSNDFRVLEINGSVTLSKFASFSSQNHNIAKSIYKEAILSNLK